MKISNLEQRSPEWFDLRTGKISGTRFSKVVSNSENNLVYDLANEIIDGFCLIDDGFINDAMQYGIDNEDLALELYSKQTGIKVQKVGAILSDFNDNHMGSPDGLNEKLGIVQEVKCTMNGAIHLKRINQGVESNHLPQIVNYFALSDEVKEVHFISYCGLKELHPIHIIKFNRESLIPRGKKEIIIEDLVTIARNNVNYIIDEAKQIAEDYSF